MYSGDKVLYAISKSMEDTHTLLLKYASKNNIILPSSITAYDENFDLCEYDDLSDCEKLTVLDAIIKFLGFQFLRVIGASCCNLDYSNTLYIGVELGSNHVAYREQVRQYDNFASYQKAYMNEVVKMNTLLNENQAKYEKEFKILLADCVPKIFSMANDCYRCT